jgi:hypothetical protein
VLKPITKKQRHVKKRTETLLQNAFPRSRKIHEYTTQIPLENRTRPVDPFRIRHDYAKLHQINMLEDRINLSKERADEYLATLPKTA